MTNLVAAALPVVGAVIGASAFLWSWMAGRALDRAQLTVSPEKMMKQEGRVSRPSYIFVGDDSVRITGASVTGGGTIK